jgi:ADP-ribose pyrophosphatase YjhB (NUDIX family)
MKDHAKCPRCGEDVSTYRNPFPTTDIIIRLDPGIVLIKRKNPPFGWALPGGFIDYGESAEHAAVREAAEETCLKIRDLKLFGVYSAPNRDPRFHTLTVVFAADAEGVPKAADDAKEIGIFTEEHIPAEMAFDHADILRDYFASEHGGGRL